jgi:hypothetical protein
LLIMSCTLCPAAACFRGLLYPDVGTQAGQTLVEDKVIDPTVRVWGNLFKCANFRCESKKRTKRRGAHVLMPAKQLERSLHVDDKDIKVAEERRMRHTRGRYSGLLNMTLCSQ